MLSNGEVLLSAEGVLCSYESIARDRAKALKVVSVCAAGLILMGWTFLAHDLPQSIGFCEMTCIVLSLIHNAIQVPNPQLEV